ncbi:MAG: glycoside hydrolase family 30 beta sandwich domain-containing protein [Chitinivibrionales bacterium]|nr:glycoside hydrolase family 30 beta sandwich domain-containing protein [Chitinivibrionales bacterium]
MNTTRRHEVKKWGPVLPGAVLTLFAAVMAVFPATAARWRCSTPASAWVDKGAVSAVANVAGGSDIVIDTTAKYQVMDGFGGAFNEMGWKPMLKLGQALRDSVMRELFGPSGCNYTFCRMPIGACDFAYGYYSLDDHAGDYAMTNFSIARDSLLLIPFIRAAMAANPHLRVWGSPWTPPIWMKSNNSFACTGTNSIAMNAQTLTAYALYLEKAVKAYQAAGLDFFALFFQNEPYACQNFPSCLWTGTDMRDFIKLYLGPKFKADNINCQLWTPTVNNGSYTDAFAPMLDDTACSKYLTGVGFQWAGINALPTVYQLHPEKKLWGTESECMTGQNSWADAVYIFGRMVLYFRGGCGNYMQWNMILDKSALSFWNWSQNSMITVDTIAGTVVFTPEFYMTKHFTNAVLPNARRVKISGGFNNSAQDYQAFLNPDGQVIVVVMNTGADAAVKIRVGGLMITPTLPASSFNTFWIYDNSLADVHAPAAPERQTGRFYVDNRNGRLIITAQAGCRTLKIFSSNGKLKSRLNGSAAVAVPVTDWPAGVYFVEGDLGSNRIVQKVLINK